jgi:hypothetical protein
MNSILDLLAQNIGGAQMGQLAQAIGADQSLTQKAIGAALPAILAGMNRNTNTNEGAQALAGALDRDHDGSLLDNIGGFLSGALSGSRAADGGGILGHILGGQQAQVEQGVAEASGLNMAQVTKLLMLLAPIVMAALGRTKRAANLDSAGLSGILGEETTRAREAAPSGLLGALTGFLDANNDGSITDDLMKQAGQAALGRLFGR